MIDPKVVIVVSERLSNPKILRLLNFPRNDKCLSGHDRANYYRSEANLSAILVVSGRRYLGVQRKT